MDWSNNGILALFLGGVVYAFLKLGDELVRVLDELGYLLVGLDDLVVGLQENTALSIGSVVLLLFGVFFAIAIADYVVGNLDE